MCDWSNNSDESLIPQPIPKKNEVLLIVPTKPFCKAHGLNPNETQYAVCNYSHTDVFFTVQYILDKERYVKTGNPVYLMFSEKDEHYYDSDVSYEFVGRVADVPSEVLVEKEVIGEENGSDEKVLKQN